MGFKGHKILDRQFWLRKVLWKNPIFQLITKINTLDIYTTYIYTQQCVITCPHHFFVGMPLIYRLKPF